MTTELWWPENYCVRPGYEYRCQPPYDGPPHYPNLPTLVVFDAAETHFTGARLKLWRKARARALSQWEWETSLLFRVRVRDVYKAGRVHIDVTKTADGTLGQADFGALPTIDETPMAGIAWAHVDSAFFEQSYLSGFGLKRVAGVLCHELGHIFGFGHDDINGSGIMTTAASGSVSDEERLALKRAFPALA